MGINDIIRELGRRKKARVARALGVQYQGVCELAAGRRKYIEIDALRKIESYLRGSDDQDGSVDDVLHGSHGSDCEGDSVSLRKMIDAYGYQGVADRIGTSRQAVKDMEYKRDIDRMEVVWIDGKRYLVEHKILREWKDD